MDIITSIDFKALREQKQELLSIIESCDNVQRVERLEGVVALIDAIQDCAVDELGISEHKVFEFSTVVDRF